MSPSRVSSRGFWWIVGALIAIALVIAIILCSGLWWGKWMLPKASITTPAPVVAQAATQAPLPTAAPAATQAPLPTAAPAATLAPTDVPKPTAAPAASADTSVNGRCPTTAEAQDLFGVSVQRLATEACAWVWRGKPQSAEAICPPGYTCTWDVVNDITVVHEGIGQKANIYAGTWRLVSAYPENDAVCDTCALFLKEKAFAASEVPSYEVRFQAVPDQGPQVCPEK